MGPMEKDRVDAGFDAGVELYADVAVVGGGLAGLAAAASAAESGRRVVLLEAHSLGGRARVDDRNGFLFNRGPRALYLGGAGKAVLDRFGVRTDLGGPPHVKGAMGRRAGRLHLLPGGPASMLRTTLLGPTEKLRAAALLARLPKLDPAEFAGRSVSEWLAATGVPPRVVELVLTIVRVTTYTNAPDVVDAGAAIANLQLGLVEGVSYLDGGFATLVAGLRQAAGDRVEVRSDAAVRGLTTGPGGVHRVHTDAGTIEASSVVLAVGGPDAAAALLAQRPPGWRHLGPPATAACLELGLSRPPRHSVVFGVDDPLYLSLHSPPAALAPEGYSLVHVLRYQPPGDDMPAADQRAQLRALAADAGIADADIVEERFLARMELTGGVPSAAGGGLAGRPTAQVEGRPGLLVAGDWVGPEGMLADAALASGYHAGQLAVARSAEVAVV